MSDTFSKRLGYHKQSETEIIVRHDAPFELRGVLVDITYECGFRPKTLRPLVCRILRKREDPNNWSEYPNVDDEIRMLIDECEWYKVYDIVEGICNRMDSEPYLYERKKYEHEVNEYLLENGIGWQLTDGKIEVRGPENFEKVVKTAAEELKRLGKDTSRNELHESLMDLSRRPDPDVTGAIQHAMAALECVARDICGDRKSNLGDIMKKHRGLIPVPLDEAVIKAWGYASENARHIREGREPSFEEAELIVGLCASVSTYLTKKEK